MIAAVQYLFCKIHQLASVCPQANLKTDVSKKLEPFIHEDLDLAILIVFMITLVGGIAALIKACCTCQARRHRQLRRMDHAIDNLQEMNLTPVEMRPLRPARKLDP